MAEYPPWSDLPQELLSTIATKLGSNPIYMLSFRSVCKSWRSSSSPPLPKLFHPLPLIIPSPPHIVRYNSCTPNVILPTCMLSVTVVHALRSRMPHPSCCCSSSSPRDFLLFLDQFIPGKVSFRQPFRRHKYRLPITFPREIDMLSFQASELGRFYNLAFPDCMFSGSSDGYEIKYWSGVVRKVVLFSSANDGGSLFVVALYEEGQLGLLRLLVNDDQKNENVGALTKWEIIHYGKGFRFDDIVDFKGRVLGVDRRGRVYNIDLGSSPTMINDVIVPAIIGGGGRRKRLVESLGCLHLVVRTNARDRTSALFKVYQLCEDTKNWVEVSSLGDQTFFIGLDFSISASADQLHGSCGKNWILYRKRSFLKYDGKDDDDDELFRSLNYDQLCIGVWRLEAAAHLSVIGSYLDYANVFWPPPTWFRQSAHIDESECLEALLTELEIFQKRIHEEKSKVRFVLLNVMGKECVAKLKMRSLSLNNLLNRVENIENLLEETERIDVHQHYKAETCTIKCMSIDSLQRAIAQFLDSLRRSVQKFNNSDFQWFWMIRDIDECFLEFEETLVFFEKTLLRARTQ